jgi:hypothetical protein
VEELHKHVIASNLPTISGRLTDHHEMKEMPDVCISIYKKEFQKSGHNSPAKEFPQACIAT